MRSESRYPERHPVRRLFQNLTDRALEQSSLPDQQLRDYLTDMLIDFIRVDRLFRLKDRDGEILHHLIDMLREAARTSGTLQKSCYQQIADYSLFILGMFPESLSARRRAIPRSYYVDTGRHCYRVASQLESDSASVVLFRKLADRYERCVLSLNWIREYTTDPFYQFMLRQFGVT